MSSPELTPIERFIFIQAMYDALGAKVSTKEPGNMRSVINDEYREVYDRTGGKTYSLKFLGEKVGTYSISESRGTPDKVTREFEVIDRKALAEWFPLDNDAELFDRWVSERWPEFARYYFEETGEMPPGCSLVEHVTKGKPAGTYSGNALRGFDANKVLELATANGYLPSNVAGLLGGGAE